MTNSHAPHIPSRPSRKVDDAEDARLPKVAICVPSGDTVHKGFAMALGALGIRCGFLRIPIALVGTEGSLIVRNRCESIDHAQRLGVDYVLFLDSDMQFPPDTLSRLLAHGKDIVGATYVQREPPNRLLGKFLPDTTLTSDRVHEVEALPAGCLLIKLSVFEGMARPYFRTEAHEEQGDDPAWFEGEDYYFCRVARERGHQLWLDAGLSMQLGHIGRFVNVIATQRAEQPEEANHGQAVH